MDVRGPRGQNLRHRTLTLRKRQKDGATRLAGIGIIANSARQPTATLMSSIQTLVKGRVYGLYAMLGLFFRHNQPFCPSFTKRKKGNFAVRNPIYTHHKGLTANNHVPPKPGATHHSRRRNINIIKRGSVAAGLLLSLSACVTQGLQPPAEGIGFREARFEEISAMRSYRSCRDAALKLDSQARKSGATGRYIASARMLENCEADLGGEAAEVARDERMQAYALSVQNYLKGGDMEKAAANFERFRKAFPGKDLYYTDGSSFIETMEVLLNRKQASDFAQFSNLNVRVELKDEMRRVRYWKRN